MNKSPGSSITSSYGSDFIVQSHLVSNSIQNSQEVVYEENAGKKINKTQIIPLEFKSPRNLSIGYEEEMSPHNETVMFSGRKNKEGISRKLGHETLRDRNIYQSAATWKLDAGVISGDRGFLSTHRNRKKAS